MLALGPAKKVTIHLNEDTSSGHDFLYNEVFQFLREHGAAGASMLWPQASFGSHHRLHTAESGSGNSEHLPVRIEFIENPAKVEELLPSLRELVVDGMIEVQDTFIVKSASVKDSL